MFGSLPSLSMKAPVVEGSDTKSKQTNWKSSWTIVLPASLRVEPKPLEEMPHPQV